MTSAERDKLDVFLGEFRDFRDDDRDWKANISARVTVVEAFVTSKKAVEERETARGVSRRSYIASAIAALGVLFSLALGLVNALR